MRARIPSLWKLLLILLPVLVTGCATLVPQTPADAGKAITFGYLLAESKLSDGQREAVKTIWMAFDATMRAGATKDASEIKAQVSGVVAAKFDGDMQRFALIFLNQAFDRLLSAVDWDHLTADERWQQLQQFHDAITETLKLYSGGTGDETTGGPFRHGERAVGADAAMGLRPGGGWRADDPARLPLGRGIYTARTLAVCRAAPGRPDVPGGAGARCPVCLAPRDPRDSRPRVLAAIADHGRGAGQGWCLLAGRADRRLVGLACEDAELDCRCALCRVALC